MPYAIRDATRRRQFVATFGDSRRIRRQIVAVFGDTVAEFGHYSEQGFTGYCSEVSGHEEGRQKQVTDILRYDETGN